jgi:hypothetical protein
VLQIGRVGPHPTLPVRVSLFVSNKQTLATQDRQTQADRRNAVTATELRQSDHRCHRCRRATPARAGSLDKDEIAPFNPAN